MSAESDILVSACDLQIGYQSGRPIIKEGLHLELAKNELVCLLGPNGSGKSTLIRTLAGLQLPLRGTVAIQGRPLPGLSRNYLARKLSIVLTDRVMLGNFTVYDLVALGRLPYTGIFGKLAAEDHKQIVWALKATEALHLLHRDIAELSDGEMQKVMMARALAQDTPVLLLDEPTAHLDLSNRIHIMRLLKKQAQTHGKAVVISTHELDIALQIADKIWILDGEGLKSGTPQQIVMDGTIQEVFGSEEVQFDPKTGTFKIAQIEEYKF